MNSQGMNFTPEDCARFSCSFHLVVKVFDFCTSAAGMGSSQRAHRPSWALPPTGGGVHGSPASVRAVHAFTCNQKQPGAKVTGFLSGRLGPMRGSRNADRGKMLKIRALEKGGMAPMNPQSQSNTSCLWGPGFCHRQRVACAVESTVLRCFQLKRLVATESCAVRSGRSNLTSKCQSSHIHHAAPQ